MTRSTVCDQILSCAGVLEPLHQLMFGRVWASVSLHTDDTPVPLLAPRRTAHARVYVGDPASPYAVSDLPVGWSRDAPTGFLKNYKGFVHADGYGCCLPDGTRAEGSSTQPEPPREIHPPHRRARSRPAPPPPRRPGDGG